MMQFKLWAYRRYLTLLVTCILSMLIAMGESIAGAPENQPSESYEMEMAPGQVIVCLQQNTMIDSAGFCSNSSIDSVSRLCGIVKAQQLFQLMESESAPLNVYQLFFHSEYSPIVILDY